MALAAFGLLLAMTPAAAASPSLFGTVEFRAESLAALPQWLRVLRQIEAEREIYADLPAHARSVPVPPGAGMAGDDRRAGGSSAD